MFSPATVMTLAFATRGPIRLAAAVIGTPLSKTVGPVPFIVVIGGMCLFVAVGGRSRGPWVVTTAATFELMLAVPWTLLVLVLTVPCGLSGTGILEPSAGCPVETGHLIKAITGGFSCLTLLVSIGAGYQYAAGRQERARRVFQIALAIAAVLILAWCGSGIFWPITHFASD